MCALLVKQYALYVYFVLDMSCNIQPLMFVCLSTWCGLAVFKVTATCTVAIVRTRVPVSATLPT